MRLLQATRESIARVESNLAKGRIAVIPTDTVYGVVASIEKPGAVDRIFNLKKRDRSKAIAVLIHSLDQGMTLGNFSEEALSEARSSWPGALTMVLPRLPSAGRFDLGGDALTIGLRVPDHRFVLALIEEVGPLAATSANLSGSPVSSGIEQIVSTFGDEVDLYVDGGILGGKASRVVSFLGESKTLRD